MTIKVLTGALTNIYATSGTAQRLHLNKHLNPMPFMLIGLRCAAEDFTV